MPLKAMSDDRKVLLIAAAVLLLLLTAVALFAPSQEQELFYPSSYSAQSGGAKAAYLLLAESNYNVERWLRPPQELPPGPETVLILAQPFPRIEKDEREALQKFLAQGGRIVAVGFMAAMLLPEDELAYGAAIAKACPT